MLSVATTVIIHLNNGLEQCDKFLQQNWQSVVVLVPFVWLILFFLAPFLIVLKISVAESLIASPPFSDLLDWSKEGLPAITIKTDNYAYLWEDELYINTYFNSIKIASICTLACLLLGYPMAYAIVKTEGTTKYVLLLLIILPFWTSFLLRVYAWMGLLADQGTINDLLLWIGFIDKPIRLLYSEFAVYIGIIYTYLPFMILPLYANMEKLDIELHEAAADLGAKPTSTFFTVTLPLTLRWFIACFYSCHR
jgi:putrescine transport system permease protein